MNNWWVRYMVFCVLCFSFACTRQVSDKDVIHHRKIPPVRLGVDTTYLNLQDLIPKEVQLDTVYSESDIEINIRNGQLQIVNREKEDWIGAMRLVSGDSILDIPIYFPTERKWEFFFPDPTRQYQEVYMVGDMNAWDPQRTPLTYNEGNWELEMWLRPGRYGYQLQLDGEMQLDPYNEEKVPNGIGGINSLLIIEGTAQEKMPLISFEEKEGRIIIHSTKPNNQFLAFWNNLILPLEEAKGKVSIEVPAALAKEHPRSYIRVYAQNEYGRSNDLLIPLDNGRLLDSAAELRRSDIHAMRLYFLMVDRFFNGTQENDKPTDDPNILPIANFMGGDIQGVYQKIQEGYFDELNMNSIWLSPIPKNPEGAFGLWDKGGVRSEFSAYHGYWPISFTEIDPRFGNKQALKEMIELAHEKEKNVLLDFVANHVHEQHPVYQEHKDEGWATNLYLPDGSLNTEQWDAHRLTTWFDTFLPTLNLEKQEITEMLSDSAIFWLKEYDVDGFRHDATKHIPLNFWRTLTDKVRSYERQRETDIFQIGETYGTAELIGSYLGYGLLDAQFDFNMYDQLVGCLTTEEGDFHDLEEQIRESLAYFGHHHLMGNMSGNQDKTRFMSLATGEVRLDEDGKLAGWTRDIDQQTEEGFAVLSMMHAFNFGLPGIPVVYYGDEIGMPGGNDPDNRRMMRFNNLSEEELKMRDRLSRLADLRATILPLQFGSTEILKAEKDVIFILRTFGSEAILLAYNKGEDHTIQVELPFKNKGEVHAHFSSTYSLETNQFTIKLSANSYEFVTFNKITYEK